MSEAFAHALEAAPPDADVAFRRVGEDFALIVDGVVWLRFDIEQARRFADVIEAEMGSPFHRTKERPA